jgi:DNA-binding GntR family transcriptional regulator
MEDRMPEIERRVPQHLQVAGYYKRQILDGEIRSGDRIPSVRDIMAQWKVSHQTAQRAIEYLSKVEGLVRTGPDGTFVNGHRVKYGPQQRARAKHFPATEREEVLAAGMAEAPPYIVPILGLLEAWPGFFPVLRREWVTYENGDIPFLLTVSWCMPESASAVPELLDRSRLPDPAGAASLIAARTGREEPVGRFAFEPRPPKDDGREIPLLRLPPGDWVGAVVSTWTSGEAVIEYREEVSTRHVIEFGPE